MSAQLLPPIQPAHILPLFINSVRDYALLLLDPDGNITSWNQGAQLIKGYRADEIIGRHFSCFYPPNDIAAGKPQRELRQSAACGRFEDIGYRIRKDGSRFLANVVITAIRDTDGTLLGFGKVTRDITDRFEAEERVRASEARLRTLVDTLFDTVVDGLVTINRRGQIQGYNKACAELFGYSREEAIGSSVNMLVVQTGRSVRHRIGTGTDVALGAGRDALGQRKDGTVFPIRLAIGENPDSSEHAFVAIIHDLSEERHAQAQLRAREEQLKLLITEAPAGIAMLDRDMRYLAHSRRFVDDYRLGNQSLLGRSHYEVFPEIAERWKDIFRRCAAGAIERSTEDTFTRADGQTGRVRWEIHPWHDADGAVGGIILFSEVITEVIAERRRAERILAETQRQLRQTQTMAAIGRLTGGMAHAFNNLLGVIMGTTELLAEAVRDDPLQSELASEIMRGAESGAELTRRLLAFGRRQALRPATINPGEYLANLIPTLQRTLGPAIQVRFSASPDLWPTYVDPSQFGDALLNLAINARDAMPAGGRLTIEIANASVSDDVTARSVEAMPGDYVVLAVTDTGCGMPPDVLAHAIEPFFTTKPPGVGTGLGLSMTYGFVRQSGGYLQIDSEVGVGTGIRLFLPRSQAGNTGSADTAPQRTDLPRGTASILLVEDKVAVGSAARRQLASLGYTVEVAADGPAALALLRSGGRFDLLFTDIVMPGGMNGYQLAEAARLLRPEIAVLFTTGDAHNLTLGRLAGKRPDLLPKPYQRRQLAEAIHAALTRSG